MIVHFIILVIRYTIAKTFTSEKIPRPSASESLTPEAYARYNPDDSTIYSWSNHMINQLIRNPVYAGHLKAQNRPTKSIKSKKKYPRGSKSFIVYNTHEPIIPPEKWELAQKMLSANRYEKIEDGYENIFAGLLECADCGGTMSMKRIRHKIPRPDPLDYVRYYCVTYRHFSSTGCTFHRLDARDLHETVIAHIRRLARYATDHDEQMARDIIAKLNTDLTDNTKKTEQDLRKTKKRLTDLDRMFSALFEEKVNGNITERNYKQLSAQYEKEQLQLEQQIAGYEENLRNAKVEQENAYEFVNLIKNYAGITELNAAILHTLIDKLLSTKRISSTAREYRSSRSTTISSVSSTICLSMKKPHNIAV